MRLTRVRFIQDGRFSPGKLVVCEIDQGQIHTGREVLTRLFVRLTRVRFIQDGRFSPGKLVVCEIDQGQIHTGREVLTR